MSKNFIKKISKDHLKSSEITLQSLQGAINRIKKTFPRYSSFLMEFFQNSDDAKASSLYIELSNKNLLFKNNGLKFTKQDVKALCMVGNSEKNVEEGYIGYLGVGFKSIFIISDSAEIQSGKFHFKFDKNYWDTKVPWEIIPIWIEDNKTYEKMSSETVFKLLIKNKNGSENIRRELNTSNLNNRILLFMQNVEDITINDVDNKNIRRINKQLEESNKYYKKFRIKEYVNKETKTSNSWLVFNSICNVPKEVQNDELTIEWERQNVKNREVAIAFRLDENNDILVEKQGTAHIGVFSFLPLKEIPSGLNYSIQGDYITTAGRADLARDNKWNEWISTQIYQLIKENCIPYFREHDQWKWNITKIFYSAEGGHEIFENFIKNPLHTFLETDDVLIDIDEEKCNSENAIYLGQELLDMFTNQELKNLYPNNKILHHKCQVHPKILKQSSRPLYEFIKYDKFFALAKNYANQYDKEWFITLYRKLVQKYDINYFRQIRKESKFNVKRDHCWAQIAKSSIMLTNRFTLVSANKCYTNPNKIKIPKVLNNKIKVVHPSFLENPDFTNFRWELKNKYHNSQGYGYNRSSYDTLDVSNNLKELNNQIINNELEKYYLKSMNKSKWKKLNDEKKWTLHVIFCLTILMMNLI